MSKVLLYCKESNGMRLGPGDPAIDYPKSPDPWTVIRFTNHYAELDDESPHFAKQMSWVNSPGCPHIDIVDPADPDAPRPFNPDDFACLDTVPTSGAFSIHEVRGTEPCPARFKTKGARDAHMINVHKPKVMA